jgi:predicted cupin superfamily sugar epimerase
MESKKNKKFHTLINHKGAPKVQFASASECIENLAMQPHPEGGYYAETYRSKGNIGSESLPESMIGQRSYATAIYFLLQSGEVSRFHRIQSDELWFFHSGSPLEISIIDPKGHLEKVLLGPDFGLGQRLQQIVPAGSWFGAKLVPSFLTHSLVSCVVAPGFDFRDFELARAKDLEHFPVMRQVPELCPDLDA